MSNSAKSVFAFAIYVLVLGAVLVVAPNFLLQVFGIPTTDEVWIRVVGVLVLVIAFYYLQSARQGNAVFFPLTVYGRSAVFVFFVIFVVLKFVSPVLILFGAVDLAGAVWTWLALRREATG